MHDIQHLLMHALGFSHLGDRNQLRWFRQKNEDHRKECDISKYQDKSIDDDQDQNDFTNHFRNGDYNPEQPIAEVCLDNC